MLRLTLPIAIVLCSSINLFAQSGPPFVPTIPDGILQAIAAKNAHDALAPKYNECEDLASDCQDLIDNIDALGGDVADHQDDLNLLMNTYDTHNNVADSYYDAIEPARVIAMSNDPPATQEDINNYYFAGVAAENQCTIAGAGMDTCIADLGALKVTLAVELAALEEE